MSVNDDLAYFNRGLSRVFQDKPVTGQDGQSIRDDAERAKWQAKRIRRTQSDTATLVADYSHHEGDRGWSINMLTRLPLNKRKPAMLKYAQIYEDTLQQVDDDNRKHGDARRASNTWLVSFLDKQG